MEVWITEICVVANSPVGMCDSLSGFFYGKTGVGRSFCTFFHIFPNWVTCFGSKNRIVLWVEGVFRLKLIWAWEIGVEK